MFDNRLQQLREEKGLNKKETARQLGIAYTTYVGYEGNEREPNSETLIKISRFFDVDVDYLIGISPCKRHANHIAVGDLGLSENSINILKQLEQEDKDTLSTMIEHPNFLALLQDFGRYKQDCADKSTTEKSFEEFYNGLSQYGKDFYAVENPTDYEYLLFQSVERQLEYMLNRPKDIIYPNTKDTP